MSAGENPNMQALQDPARQLPPGDLFLAPKVAAAADWVGRMQVQTGQFLAHAYDTACDRSASLFQEVRHHSHRLKQENPVALLGGIAGTAFAVGVAVRIWRSSR
jgi:hypothetical protein